MKVEGVEMRLAIDLQEGELFGKEKVKDRRKSRIL